MVFKEEGRTVEKLAILFPVRVLNSVPRCELKRKKEGPRERRDVVNLQGFKRSWKGLVEHCEGVKG